MMVQWINSMSNLKKVLEKSNKEHKVPTVTWCWYKPWTWDFYTKAVSFFLVILLISLGGMYKVDRENLFSLTKETTTKNIPNPVTNKIINQSKVENKNKEITVVEKITLSNHTNGKGFDKDN